MSFRKFRAARVSTINATDYVGQHGDVFYSEDNGQFRVSDGVTPGGHIVMTTLDLTNSTANIFVNNITVAGTTTTVNNIISNNQTTLTGVLEVTGNAVFNGNTITNGRLILNGPMDNIGDNTFIGNVTTTGHLHVTGPSEFTGDTVFIGNVTEVGNLTITGKAINNGPSIFNGDMVIAGNTTQTGQTIFVVPLASATQGAVEITGDATNDWQNPVNTGVMLQVTGQPNLPSRIYNDAQGNYSLVVGRRYEGTMSSPTGVQGNVDIVRYAGTPYTTGGWANIGPARITITTNEVQTATNQGGRIEFWTTANSAGPAYSTVRRTATIDPALGVTSTGFYTTGNVYAGNVIANTIGTLSGNVIGTILTASQPNITSVGTLANLTVDGADNGSGLTLQGNLRYDIAYGNGTVTQLTDKTTTVTCNGKTGQITTTASSLAKGVAVTFTVNNSYVTSVTDVPVVVFQSGATTNSYAVSVTRVQVGSFNITITNNGTGPLTDTIIINFAIIKVS